MNIEQLTKRFNDWADDRIGDLENAPTFSDGQKIIRRAKIDTLRSAKENLMSITITLLCEEEKDDSRRKVSVGS